MAAQQVGAAPNTAPVARDGIVTRRLSDALGAEVIGADIATVAFDFVQTLFLEHKLLVFRDQHLTDADIQTFAEAFGPLEVNKVRTPSGLVMEAVHAIANVDAHGRPSANPLLKTNYNWHSDKSYLPVPSLTTMLYGVEIPPAGGDTQFANMEQAFDDLPADTRREIDGLRVVQSFDYMLDCLGRPPIIAAEDIPPPAIHPLVRTHPDTGRKSLFVGMYSADIVGMKRAEGRALIARLLAHATQERYVYTQKWRARDFVFWDNRSLIHRALPNYEMGTYRRVLRRCVVRGTVPN